MSNLEYVKKAFIAIASAFLLLSTAILLKMGIVISTNYILWFIFYFSISSFFAVSVILINEAEKIVKRKKKKK